MSPCNPSWGYDDDKGIEVSRLAVQSGVWALYEWKDGVFRRRKITKRADVRDYVACQRRYSHLRDEGIGFMEGYVNELDDMLSSLEIGFGA